MKNIQTIRAVCVNLLLIFAGSLLCALAIKGIIIPKQYLAGGPTGLSLVVVTELLEIMGKRIGNQPHW